MRWSILLLSLGGCAFTEPIAPGEGTLSQASSERLRDDEKQAERERAEVTCRLAASEVTLRPLRKCAELVAFAADDGEHRWVYEKAKPALARLEASDAVCEALPPAAQAHRAAGARTTSLALELKAARACQDSPAARRAANDLAQLSRCGEVPALAKEAWPWATTDDEQVAWLDRVADCSDAYGFEKNVAFVPGVVRERYAALLRARVAEERRYQAERCVEDCGHKAFSCRSGCWNSTLCRSQCEAVEALCRLGCQ